MARIVVCAAALVNLVLVNVGYLQLFLLIVLTGPASTFILAVADVTGGDDAPAN